MRFQRRMWKLIAGLRFFDVAVTWVRGIDFSVSYFTPTSGKYTAHRGPYLQNGQWPIFPKLPPFYTVDSRNISRNNTMLSVDLTECKGSIIL
jgi:hypothetical protein